jgi:cytochrome c
MRIQAFTQGKIKEISFRRVSIHHVVFGMVVFSMMALGALTWVSPFGVSAGQNTSGDPNRGREVFEKRCIGCHSLDREKHGPRLRGVFGRKSGSIASFKYSDALKSANVIWDAASLEQWLTDPDKFIPDNDMDFRLSNSDERNDVIAYLKQQSN